MRMRNVLIVLGFLWVAGVGCSKENNIAQTTNNDFTTINNITQIVGPMGGHVESPDGAAVDIPAGALTEEVSISISTVIKGTPALPSGSTAASKTFAFEPHGQTFAADVVVSLPQTTGTTAVTILRAELNGDWSAVANTDATTNLAQTKTTTFSYFVAIEGGESAGGAAGTAGSAGGTSGTAGSGGSGGSGASSGAGGMGAVGGSSGSSGTGGGAGASGAAGSSASAGAGGSGGSAGTGGSAGGCPAGSVDLDGDPLTGPQGCEYTCTKTSTEDPLDDAYTDDNCDGSDGVVEQCFFVSATTGTNSPTCGTRIAPCGSIDGALTAIASQGSGTWAICLGGETFPESVELPSGVSLYGGFDQFDAEFSWRRKAGIVSTLNGVDATNTTVLIPDAQEPMHIEGISIETSPATLPTSEPSAYGIRWLGGSAPLYVRWTSIQVSAPRAGNTGNNGDPATSCVDGGGAGEGGEHGGAALGVFVTAGTLEISSLNITILGGATGGDGGDGGDGFGGCPSPTNGMTGTEIAPSISNGLYLPGRAASGTVGTTGGVGFPGAGGNGGPSACIGRGASVVVNGTLAGCSTGSAPGGGQPGTNILGMFATMGSQGSSTPNFVLP